MRPVYLDLFRLHLPLPGWVSILHRITGVLLFVFVPLAVAVLSASLADAAGFERVVDSLAHPLGKFTLLLGVWAFAHHLFAGVRHLALDAHWGVGLRRARQSSVAVMFASLALTLAAAWRLFA